MYIDPSNESVGWIQKKRYVYTMMWIFVEGWGNWGTWILPPPHLFVYITES